MAADYNMWQEELCHAIEGAALTLSGANNSQLRQAIVALSHVVGELVHTEYKQTLGVYFPAVDRSVDQDISATNYPVLVPALRGIKASVKGVTDHSVTVAGSVVTFPSTVAADALLLLLENDAKASNWLNAGQTSASPATADYSTVATRRCLNVAGTDYAITAVNVAGRTATVSGTPATGAQTASCYTYRIAGSTTTARLHKIAGFVGVVAGDADGVVVGGFRKMDQGQGHYHDIVSYLSGAAAGSDRQTASTAGSAGANDIIRAPKTDGVNGTPRTGKTTDPRTIGQYAYTWAGVYVP